MAAAIPALPAFRERVHGKAADPGNRPANSRDVLEQRGRVRVALTREDDRYLTLEQRAGIARRLHAGLFLSLHMDSAPNPLARGATVYSLSDVASDAEAARFAEAENRRRSACPGSRTIASAAPAGRPRPARADGERRRGLPSGWSAGPPAGSSFARGRTRFAAFHVLRRAGNAGGAVRGRLHQQCR